MCPTRMQCGGTLADMSIDTITESVGEFACPRCGSAVTERFYGPCTNCRSELAATLWRTSDTVAELAYIPKANVTPNFIATKE